MAELPTEIIMFNILSRLPPKAVGRCKSVCRTWYWRLNGNAFLREHCSRSAIPSNQKVLVIEPQSCSSYPIDFQTHDYQPGTRIIIPFNHLSYDNTSIDVSILSHLNGLLCVCHNLTSDLFLWNPVTTAFKRLPPPFFNDFYKDTHDAVGLYTDAYDDFKVLYIRRRDQQLAVNVYSRNQESWRNIPFTLTLPTDSLTTEFNFSSGTLCGGRLYFTVLDIILGGGRSFMISFDVNSEQFEQVILPPIPDNVFLYFHLLNAQDQLLLFVSTGHPDIQIDMWLLDEGAWYHLHTFDPISLGLWCSITHYVTNGRKWFVMSKFDKVFEIHTPMKWFDRFYPVTCWTYHNGTFFTETLVSPTV